MPPPMPMGHCHTQTFYVTGKRTRPDVECRTTGPPHVNTTALVSRTNEKMTSLTNEIMTSHKNLNPVNVVQVSLTQPPKRSFSLEPSSQVLEPEPRGVSNFLDNTRNKLVGEPPVTRTTTPAHFNFTEMTSSALQPADKAKAPSVTLNSVADTTTVNKFNSTTKDSRLNEMTSSAADTTTVNKFKSTTKDSRLNKMTSSALQPADKAKAPNVTLNSVAEVTASDTTTVNTFDLTANDSGLNEMTSSASQPVHEAKAPNIASGLTTAKTAPDKTSVYIFGVTTNDSKINHHASLSTNGPSFIMRSSSSQTAAPLVRKGVSMHNHVPSSKPSDEIKREAALFLPAVVNFALDHRSLLPLLIDTGASASVVSRGNCSSLLRPHRSKIKAFGGSTVDSCGTTNICIDLGFGSMPEHSFLVIDKPLDYMVLGIDFMRRHALVPRIDNDTLEHIPTGIQVPTIHFTTPRIGKFTQELFWTTYFSSRPRREANKTSDSLALTLNSVNTISVDANDRCLLLLAQYPDLTATPDYNQPPRHSHVMDIELKPEFKGCYSRARRTTQSNKQAIRDEFEDLIRRGALIRGISHTVSPITIAKKKDGKLRICVDYTRLNAGTVTMHHPLPLINEFTQRLSPNHKIFSVLDISEAYRSLPLTPRATQLAAIIAEHGTFLPLRTTFGLKNAPAYFCRMIAEAVQGMEHFCFSYLDDFLIFSETMEDHLHHLDQLFQRLNKYGLFLKPQKCHFAQSSVLFLGHAVTASGMRPLTDKVAAISAIPAPTNLKEVRSFLGSVNYYRRYLPKLAELAAPITDLLKGPPRRKTTRVVWGVEQQTSFESVKDALKEAAELAYEDPDKPLVLSTDASQHHVGSVLEQYVDDEGSDTRPLAYFSKALPTSVKVRSAFNRELTAVWYSLRFFKHRVRGRHLIIRTDHRSVVLAIENVSLGELSPYELRMVYGIREYTPTMIHIDGEKNQVADFLSRPPGHNVYGEKEFNDPEVMHFINVCTVPELDTGTSGEHELQTTETESTEDDTPQIHILPDIPEPITPALIARAQNRDPECVSEARELTKKRNCKFKVETRKLQDHEDLVCYGTVDLNSDVFRPNV